MLDALQIAAVVFMAVAMALALAHALELPGKMRLPRDVYFAVQRIYYPGFTIGGISEPAAFVCIVILCLATPRPGDTFWLALVALLALIAMQVIYWGRIHAVNKVWMQGGATHRLGGGFMGVGRKLDEEDTIAWTDLRDRWEYAHVARAAFAFIGFMALVVVVSRPDA